MFKTVLAVSAKDAKEPSAWKNNNKKNNKKWQRGCNLDQLPQSTDQRAQELAAMEQIKVQCEGMRAVGTGQWEPAVGSGAFLGTGELGTGDLGTKTVGVGARGAAAVVTG
jgi:ferric-dicitrate binding protein FerR (iron transport regulator)